MGGNGHEEQAPSNAPESEPADGPVRRAAKAIARRELFRSGGRIALGSAALSAWLLAGAGVEEARAAESPGCWSWGDCTCGGNQTCRYVSPDRACEPRTIDCPSGGQCWCEGCRRFCDYYCHGRPCHCSDSPNSLCGC